MSKPSEELDALQPTPTVRGNGHDCEFICAYRNTDGCTLQDILDKVDELNVSFRTLARLSKAAYSAGADAHRAAVEARVEAGASTKRAQDVDRHVTDMSKRMGKMEKVLDKIWKRVAIP